MDIPVIETSFLGSLFGEVILGLCYVVNKVRDIALALLPTK